jgi:hypothetical protein
VRAVIGYARNAAAWGGVPTDRSEEDEMQDLQQIEHEIEITRNRLDDNLDALAAKVDPRRVARRAKSGAREKLAELNAKIPGGDATVLGGVIVLGALLFVLPRRHR